MKHIKKAVAGALTGIAAAELGGSLYLYRRTMIRQRGTRNTKRTMKMSGADWSQYMPIIEKRKAYLLSQPHQEVFQTSNDGLKLHATYFPQGEEKKVVICFHGYTSKGMSDYIGLSDYYLKRGFSMLLVDARSHGESEGKYVGFGCLDRIDACQWMSWVIERCGEDVSILLHGTSMGGATVLMCTGLHLPKQVKGVVADCPFTSAKEVFTHVLHSMYHLPAFPMIPITDRLNQKLAGFGMDECNAAREVKKARIPALFVHGAKDSFVPAAMCEEIYENYAADKEKLIVAEAAHAESYYKDMEQYERALDELMKKIGL